MKRNQKPTYEYRKYKNTNHPHDQYEVRPKGVDGGLKSLECSSVDEVHPTNQSYENSWLEKLVNNIDDDKPNPLAADQNTRNFSRKSSSNMQQNYLQKPNDAYPRPYSYNKKQVEYTPFSKINQIQNQEYSVRRFRNNDYQRIPKSFTTSAEKYKLQRNMPQPVDEKPSADLNESTQSYGRIKKLNNQKSKVDPHSLEANLQKIDVHLARPSLTADRTGERAMERERFLNEAQNKVSNYSQQNPPIHLRESRDYHYSKFDQITALKRRGSEYFASREASPKRMEYRQRTESLTINNQVNKEQKASLPSSEKHYEKEDEFKMEEMAKKLNMVLENINKKSKMLQNGTVDEKKSNKQEAEVFEEKKVEVPLPESKYKSYSSVKIQELEHENKHKEKYVPSIQLQNKYETKYDQKYQPKYQQKYSPKHQQKYEHKYDQKYQHKYQHKYQQKYSPKYQSRYESKYEPRQETKQDPKYDLQQEQKYDVKYEDRTQNNNRGKKSEEEQSKYQMMKRSLGMSKHIPPEIILEESSSQINSEVSPRTQFLNRQFKLIFDKLDRAMIGELSKSNCALEFINDEIKYLFGGIFSKIKYKNERVTFKNFIEDCQNVVKEFQFEELKEVLGKAKNITHFKLHEKDTESERWNNQTNNESESKRSSQRSEVVKKYEFIQQNAACLEKNEAPNRQKVHWAAPQYAIQSFTQNERNDKPLMKNSFISNHNDNCLEVKDNNKITPSSNSSNSQQNTKSSIVERKPETSQNNIKQNIKMGQTHKDKKDFDKMCENLNNKLNNYLTTITKKNTGHHIPLQFSELSKHWNKS